MLFKERSTKEAGTMPPFVERLKKIHENKKWIFRTLSSKFDQKRYSTLPYCQTGLFTGCSLKEATDSFFLRAF